MLQQAGLLTQGLSETGPHDHQKPMEAEVPAVRSQPSGLRAVASPAAGSEINNLEQ